MGKKQFEQQENFASVVDDAILYLSLSDIKPASPKTLPLSEFNHAYLLTRPSMISMRDEAFASGYCVKGIIPPGKCWPVANLTHDDRGMLLTRMKPLAFSEKSKLLSFGVIPKRYSMASLFSVAFARIDTRKGEYRADRFIVEVKGQDEFRYIETVAASFRSMGSSFGGKEAVHVGVSFGEFAKSASIAPGLSYYLACMVPRVWCVSFSQPGASSIRMATDPTGIKSLFSMRDKPEGRTRREALLHWVTDHWRKQRTDPSTESYVRNFLRGGKEFQWFGLQCEVKPSVDDLRKNEDSAEQRLRNGKMVRQANPSA